MVRVEIWRNEELEDFAEVIILKDSNIIDCANTGYGTWVPENMPYDEGIKWLNEEGYTEHDEFWDSFDSWEEYDEYVTA